MGPLTMGTFTSTFQYGSALANAFLWQNTTAGTVSTTNGSPQLSWQANYWTGSASASDTWTFSHALAAGANATSIFSLAHSGSSGTSYVSLPNLIVSNIIATNSNANLLFQPNGTGSVIFPNGTATNPGWAFAAATQFGFYSASATNIAIGTGSSAHDSHNFTTAGLVRILSGGAFCLSSSATDATTACDTGISRSAAGVMAVGNGTSGDTSGKIKAAALISVGTKFSTNAGCSEASLVGGATVGQFVLGANSCSVVVTMGNSATAPNGWACSLQDFTTAANVGIRETATNATTATLTFTGVPQVSDVIVFACTGY